MADTIKVCVRVRPFNNREMSLKSKLVVRMQGNTTYLIDPDTGKERSFAFDYSMWSNDPKDKHFVSQPQVFEQLGTKVLGHAFEGYNCTIFAYGQTGSGKSFTMVGSDNSEEAYHQGSSSDQGVIPRLCNGIFDRIKANNDPDTTFNVEASMLEIYNEKLHDLLNPHSYGKGTGAGSSLRIRESPTLGPYVEGLQVSAVNSFEDLSLLMAEGTRNRTIGATSMNHNSSRAHTVVTVVLTQTHLDKERMQATDKVSRINLVDLAGSERQGKTDAEGDRLKEGCAINKSLSALGKCITMIAAASGGDDEMNEQSYTDILQEASYVNPKDVHRKKGEKFIPYRDSALTWLLSESLGGNAKTVMIATISPADFNYQETLSTLRYAWQAKQIKTRAVVNEDPNERMIRELKEEIMLLRAKLGGEDIGSLKGGKDSQRLQDELRNSEQMIENLNKSWEQRLRETEQKLRGQASGRALEFKGGAVDVNDVDKNDAFLLNLHEDASLSKKVAYPITRFSVFGSDPGDGVPESYASPNPGDDVTVLSVFGVGIKPQHCVFEYDRHASVAYVGGVASARVCVNGVPLAPNERRELSHNDRVVLGMNHVFVFCHPSALGQETPRGGTQGVDWESAMEEMLQGMQQKFFDPNEKQHQEDELKEKLNAVREKERALEEERERYQTMLRDIEVEYKKHNKKREGKLKARMADLEAQLESEGRMDELEDEKQRLMDSIAEEDAHEMAELEVRREDAMKKAEELDEQLESQQTKIQIFKQMKERESREIAQAEENIMRLIPLVDEANIMADEMDKPVIFEVRLQSSVSPEIFEDPLTGETVHKTSVEAGVLVTNLDNKQSLMWSFDKFTTRLYMMREEFEKTQGDSEYKVDPDADPFMDLSQALAVGKAHLWLMGLMHLIDTEDVIPVISSLGEHEGKLSVKVMLADSKGRPNPSVYDKYDSLEHLLGKRLDLVIEIPGCQGIDQSKFADVFARFRFVGSDKYTETKPVSVKRTPNPAIRFKKHVVIACVDSAFINFVQNDALTVELWGIAAQKDKDKEANNEAAKEERPMSVRRAKTRREISSSRRSTQKVNPVQEQVQEQEQQIQDLTEKLAQMEKDKERLLAQVEQSQVEVERVPTLQRRVSALESENEALKKKIAEMEQRGGNAPASARGRAVSLSPANGAGAAAGKADPRRGSAAASVGRRAASQPQKPDRHSMAGSVAKSPRAVPARSPRAAVDPKERLDRMKAKFGK